MNVLCNSYIANKRVCANKTTKLGPVISIWLARDKSFETVVSNDLRANQNDMTSPNSVVLFAQTRVFRYVTVLYHVILHIDYLALFLAFICKIR